MESDLLVRRKPMDLDFDARWNAGTETVTAPCSMVISGQDLEVVILVTFRVKDCNLLCQAINNHILGSCVDEFKINYSIVGIGAVSANKCHVDS